MGAVDEISKAIGIAQHMIVNAEIGEDVHGEVWIRTVEYAWRRLDRLIQGALSPEQEAAWRWLDLALTALFQAGELMADEAAAVDMPGVPGNNFWPYKLV